MHRATNSLYPTFLGLLCAALLLAAAPTATLAKCSVQQRTTVTLQDIGGNLLVPVAVNGITTDFVLDTGAERSMVNPAAVQRLHLALDKWVGTTMRGIGGIVQHQNALPRSLTLGGVALQRRTVTHDTSLTVGPTPLTAIAGQPVAGLLGRDFLSPFDLELNLRTDTLTLFQVHGCTGPFLPWKQPYIAIRAQQPIRTAMVLPVKVDGKALTALLDTGSTASLLTARGMIRLGLSPERASYGSASAKGVGPRTIAMQLHRFASLQIGAEVQHHPLIWAAPIRITPFVDMLLGADWLAGHRVWISFATSQVFIAAAKVK